MLVSGLVRFCGVGCGKLWLGRDAKVVARHGWVGSGEVGSRGVRFGPVRYCGAVVFRLPSFFMANKYGAIPTVDRSGRSFSSKLEASVYQVLLLRQKAGEITSIECQVPVLVCGTLGHECDSRSKVVYIADFKCIKKDASIFYVEAKGMPTPTWQIKKRLWRHHIQIPLEIWGGSWQRPHLMETLGV